jgi:hypothetical protein
MAQKPLKPIKRKGPSNPELTPELHEKLIFEFFCGVLTPETLDLLSRCEVKFKGKDAHTMSFMALGLSSEYADLEAELRAEYIRKAKNKI